MNTSGHKSHLINSNISKNNENTAEELSVQTVYSITYAHSSSCFASWAYEHRLLGSVFLINWQHADTVRLREVNTGSPQETEPGQSGPTFIR